MFGQTPQIPLPYLFSLDASVSTLFSTFCQTSIKLISLKKIWQIVT